MPCNLSVALNSLSSTKLDKPRLYLASIKNCFERSYDSPNSAPKLKDLAPSSVSNKNPKLGPAKRLNLSDKPIIDLLNSLKSSSNLSEKTDDLKEFYYQEYK